jgi:hypothetical protein
MLHGQTRYNIPSRFIDEIPREHVRVAVAAAAPRALDVDAAEWGAIQSAPQATTPPAPAGGSARACATPSSASA